ncbi:MAG: UDP-N-acetylmuramoyl-L-alanyl-D-glutamate--2,6-diaminopimelate ligase [Chloroflexota bacterium]|nr:UDP-N-acetylmuramoyl-L-alanyl-D-glutamate--2,6-diaminopimelate ligase [Chloroflexota bacterium]
MTQSLLTLLDSLPDVEPVSHAQGVSIEAVTADSRQVEPGALFVAVPGATVDGHRYIEDAIRRGAVAVVGEADLTPMVVPYCRVSDSRQALASLASVLHGHPSRALRLVGITGTDGKTTTANIIHHLLEASGMRPGMISTVGARIGQKKLDTGFHVTTPEAPDVQRLLAEMVSQGCDSAVMETTSHGLVQKRVAACDFDVAVITNVTHEHLDYHGSWDDYMAAKAQLFHSLAQGARKPVQGPALQSKVAVLNADDPSFEHLRGIPADRLLSYGIEEKQVDLRAEDISTDGGSLVFSVRGPGDRASVRVPLAGRFNVYNSLAALGAGLGLGLPLDQLLDGLETVPGIDGRMERIDRGQDFLVIVDFAHTPVSLERALRAARTMTPGRVIVVFGSAGLRDVEKRWLMPRTAVQLADITLLTAEDPRSESLEMILEQMAEGALQGGGVEGRDFFRIPDRIRAIWWAVREATAGDTVIVAGKGHERSMCFGNVEHPWRDQNVLAWAVAQRLGASEPPPYTLPTTEGELFDFN